MLRFNAIRTGYLLGISLILAAIIYFFASNWGGLDRTFKIVLAAALIVLFYGLSFVFARIRAVPGQQAFLSNMFLVAGCIAFGVSVALLGQIYNSHADSYGLFFIWSVPALLLSWITRYNPFYMLSYVLIHLGLWLYFYPTMQSVPYSELESLSIAGVFAIVNLLLFLLTFLHRIHSAPLQYMSFTVFHIAMLAMTNSFAFDEYGLIMNVPHIAVIALGFYIFIKVRLNKTLLTLNALALSAFAVFKFIELAEAYSSSLFFVFGLIFVALLLTGNVWFFRYLNRLGKTLPDSGTTDISTSKNEATVHEEHGSEWISKTVSRVIKVVGVLIGSISLIGLIMISTNVNHTEYVLLVVSLLLMILMIVIPESKLDSVIRYTLLTISYITGLAAILWSDQSLLSVLFLIVSIAGWFRSKGKRQLFFAYTFVNLNLATILFQQYQEWDGWNWTYKFIIFSLFIVNAVLYGVSYFISKTELKEHLRNSSLFFSLLFLFWATFFEDVVPHSYMFINIFYFVIVTGMVFAFARLKQKSEAITSVVFWFIFIGFKYYDLLWTLLYKSFTLALLGIIALGITWWADRRMAHSGKAAFDADHRSFSFMRLSPLLIAIVIVLQLGIIGYQTARSETLLATGASIKLKLAPVDPRSLLQGDYVALNYDISTPPSKPLLQEEEWSRGKVKVVLTPDSQGVYVADRLYQDGEKLASHEVILNGQWYGSRILYGIENYFIPEGTGRTVEQNAHFAHIRVSRNGDALLERLAES
ncbi:GDYXXLXY domain-containing protein [Paenibacillus sp. EKM212P]|uniref:GDYXXLXY domain-containing protein n=1 Tax=Paenibacillus sp. EKM212P TaxID=1683680 RepID=UPI001623560B|nr:GDYXXLXY domain-containing protein [Paenibacillus sp. EKM212P]KAF6579526.1 GDYXXLXY domain-containing protein [Paenibacillus sp. EKM212P]